METEATDTIKREWNNQYAKTWTDKEIQSMGDEMVIYFQDNENAFYFSSFSNYKMINRQRLYDWKDKNPYFAECYELVKGIIIERLMSHGLTGKNAVFPIFALKNIARQEFKDRQEIEHTVVDGKELNKDIKKHFE